MAESLTLTRDWLDMFDGLPDDASRVRLLRAVAGYAFDGLEPEDLTAVEMAVYKTIRRTVKTRKRNDRAYKNRMNHAKKPHESYAFEVKPHESYAKNRMNHAVKNPVSNQYRNTVYTPLSLDKSKEVSPTGENSTARRVFRPPTVEEVAAYCRERNNGIDPQAVIDFYESKGWMIGKNKMKDWKAAVRTWERRRHEESQNRKPIRDYSGI